ncbi:CheY-like chemotaxis protein [Flavobacterium gossypii]|jgi:Response regulator containing CheY-like receiver, AAA-type ATPase, and DNA-binding domains|uniref:CheY-like chemotaxis protein n=1 Tax=Flavobacterium gossypii TaxID=1646119 RepID=A0ABR6DSK6_9FLAO|nr:response regulator [Flavobacterium gossypii]MBA9074429.1 CheY-like chemotaxis protein [Flavobacterium gossypii]
MDSSAMTIFLVDDDQDDQQLFEEVVKEIKASNKLLMFKNAVELMEHLNQENIVLPHIIFLDLNMPFVSGSECLKEIRSNPRFMDVSVAIYSTSSLEKDIEETFINGANIYITKPNDYAALKKTIRNVLNINWHYHKSGLDRKTFFYNV